MVAVGGIVVKENQILTVRIGKKDGTGPIRIPGGIAKTTETLEAEISEKETITMNLHKKSTLVYRHLKLTS